MHAPKTLWLLRDRTNGPPYSGRDGACTLPYIEPLSIDGGSFLAQTHFAERCSTSIVVPSFLHCHLVEVCFLQINLTRFGCLLFSSGPSSASFLRGRETRRFCVLDKEVSDTTIALLSDRRQDASASVVHHPTPGHILDSIYARSTCSDDLIHIHPFSKRNFVC